MAEALAAIIKLQQDDEKAQEKLDTMQNLHIMQSEMLEQQALQLDKHTPDVEPTRALFESPWDPDAIVDCMLGGTLPYTLDHARTAIELQSNSLTSVSDQCRDVQQNVAALVVHRDQDRADQQATEQALQMLSATMNEYMDADGCEHLEGYGDAEGW